MDPATAVAFRRSDYAGLFRRLLIDLVDGLMVGAVCALLWIALWSSVSSDALLLVCLAVLYCYFVLLKRSGFGTVGYRVARVKIVAFDGRTPGLWPLTLRILFMVFGPLNYFFDILWLSTDSRRQALRDKFAQTYIVRREAEPVGPAKLIYRYYDIFGYNFLFREIGD